MALPNHATSQYQLFFLESLITWEISQLLKTLQLHGRKQITQLHQLPQNPQLFQELLLLAARSRVQTVSGHRTRRVTRNLGLLIQEEQRIMKMQRKLARETHSHFRATNSLKLWSAMCRLREPSALVVKLLRLHSQISRSLQALILQVTGLLSLANSHSKRMPWLLRRVPRQSQKSASS